MTKRSISTLLACGVALSIIPTFLFAVDKDLNAGGVAINNHADAISKFFVRACS